MKYRCISKCFTLALILNFNSISFAEPTLKSGYKINNSVLCDGLPQVPVTTPQNVCLGIMASKEDGLKMPRYAVQSPEGVIYVSEMGGWAFGKGTVYAISDKYQLVNLFPDKKLNMPNGIVMDPEGRIYIGTPTGIFRFLPQDPLTKNFIINPPLELVVDDFAKSIFRKTEYGSASSYNSMAAKLKNKHPLLQIATNKDFTEMYLNIGAPSDACTSGLKTTNEQGKCIQSDSPLASAAVWKISLSNDSKREVLKISPYARGLRNSMALAVHPDSGLVIQGENGMDLPDEDLPFEEINILEEGRHYGWPYCHSQGEVSPAFKKSVTSEMCRQSYALPSVFMPAHTAPLGMTYYQNDFLPKLKGQLLVSWHGYRKYGQRVVAYQVDEQGQPISNEYSEVISGWNAVEGLRPRGAPTGLTVLNDGSVLVLDDKNGAILRLSKGSAADTSSGEKSNTNYTEENIRLFEPLLPFLKKNCAICHSQFQKDTAPEILQELQGTMLNMKEAFESPLWIKLNNRQMPPEMIRDSLGLKEQDYVEILPKIEDFIQSLGNK